MSELYRNRLVNEPQAPGRHWPPPEGPSAIIASCADAIDFRGKSNLLRSTSIASQGKKTGVPATTSPTLSLSRSPARIPRSLPENCR